MATSQKARLANHKGWGGRRKNQTGRPPKDTQPLVARTYRVKQATDERVKALAGTENLKSEADVIDAAVAAFKP